ncbi:hypothetical protein ABMC89_06170 [Sulfitobacter sp. HNIBRBA3233]|uniref:hypothetical protein n=1 Tax=Sulfitobacter marinivivus TaxID=3158558 RepID=UPI0032DE9B62
MKPNFALSLSFEGIQLLHRAAGGWREVGEVSVSSDDLAAELAVLRKTAVSLEPGGLRSKLVIPASQIKYLTIETPGLSTQARRKEAAKALENATPYEVEDLAFDISQDGPLTHVAAVARETLSEAEGFAQEHRFHPVSFVGMPEDAPYLGEPFFGRTKAADDLLEDGEEVEPDGIAVVVVGKIDPAALTAAASTETGAEAPDNDPTVAGQDPSDNAHEAETEKPDEAPAQTAATPPSPAEDAPEAAPSGKAADQKPSSDADTVPDEPPLPAFADRSLTAQELADDPLEDAPKVAPRPDTAPKASPAQPSARSDKAAAAPVAALQPQSKGDAPLAPAPKKPTLSAARAVSAPAAAPAVGFASRRAPQPATRTGKAAAPRITPQPDSSSLTQTPPPDEEPVAAPANKKGGFLSRRKPRKGAAAPVPAPANRLPAASSEEERMTVFGARAADIGGKPRFLGLIMTVILLVFLAGVAAWAAVFLDDGIASLFGGDRDRAVASAPENQITPEVIRVPDDNQDTTTPTAEGTQVAALDPVLSASETATVDAALAPRAEPELPVISEQEAAARYAVSGIWPLAPRDVPGRPELDQRPVFQIGIDGSSGATDAIALQNPEAFDTDLTLASIPSPPPFGQSARIGDDGLIVPTDSGVVAPGGYTLVAASPPVKPPLPPTRFAEDPEEDATAAEDTPAPLLAAFRPTQRPTGLAETTERAQLGGVTFSELAAFRPSLRPRSLQERADEEREQAKADEEARARAAAEAATAAAAAALALPPAAEAPAIENATRFATTQSRRPDTRPRNFDRIVAKAQRAQPPRETQVATAAAVAPRAVAPKIPSKASVSKAATVKNAINLRQVNLIGVYGKPSSRRALVRLSNGRYKKVRVGDAIDGGRVSAIGNDELRYTKRGRNVVLKMPKG